MGFDRPALPFQVGYFGSHITNQQHIVAGEISVDDAIGVEKWESEGDVMADVDLDVVGDWLWGAFQKVGQAIIHQLH